MNFKAISSILLSVLAGAYASTSQSQVPTATTASVPAASPGTAPATGAPHAPTTGQQKAQGFLNLSLKIGPIDMEVLNNAMTSGLAGGRLQQPTATANTVPGAVPVAPVQGATAGTPAAPHPANQAAAATANAKGKYVPPAGKLYRATDDPALTHLIGLGSPEENTRFETEAGILYHSKDETDNPKLSESRAWFKQEKKRRQEIWNKQQAGAQGAQHAAHGAAHDSAAHAHPPHPQGHQAPPPAEEAGKKMGLFGKGKAMTGKAKNAIPSKK